MPMFLSIAHDETDHLFSIEPIDLAARFGERAKRQIRDGKDPFQAARLAATYAFIHRPDLRAEPPVGQFADRLFRLGNELNRLIADGLKVTVH